MACNKCRQGNRSPGDTWCLGCRALEVAQLELGRRWPCQPARDLAEEILLSATRHVKRLGELGPGLLSEPARYTLPFESGAARNPPLLLRSVPAPLGRLDWRGRGGPVREAGARDREVGPALDEDEYTYESFSEEVKAEEVALDLGTAAKSSAPPPEPAVRPLDLVLREAGRKRELEVETVRAGSKKKKNKKKDKRHRSGRKHQQVTRKPEGALSHRRLSHADLDFTLARSSCVMADESAPYGEEVDGAEGNGGEAGEDDLESRTAFLWETPGSLELQDGAVIEALLEPLPGGDPRPVAALAISAKLGERLCSARYLGTNDSPDRRRELGRLFNVRSFVFDGKEVVRGALRGGRGARGRLDCVPSSCVRGGPVRDPWDEGPQGVQCGLQEQEQSAAKERGHRTEGKAFW